MIATLLILAGWQTAVLLILHYDTENDLRELRSLVAGLREDLGAAEQRIRDLEENGGTAS